MILAPRGSRLIDNEAKARRGSQVDSSELLAIAESAAAAAAALLCDATIDKQDASQELPGQGIVTALDLAAEHCIREFILSRRPTDEILGEELGRVSGHSDIAWIIDPIDGTNNYVAGLPQWAVSIAVQMYGRTETGVVHVPRVGNTYTALAGVGAWCNGLRLPPQTARAHDLGNAVVATGFADGSDQRAKQIQQLTRVLGVVRDVRCHGAASIELCNVAAGQIDAYYESDLCLWDVAAGALVATEAGVEVSGSPWSGDGTLVAAPPTLVDPLRHLVDLTSSAQDGMK